MPVITSTGLRKEGSVMSFMVGNTHLAIQGSLIERCLTQ